MHNNPNLYYFYSSLIQLASLQSGMVGLIYISSWTFKMVGIYYKIQQETVVPTTTPPLVWPSNGQNKGAPTKILNPTPMEGWI